MLISLITSDRIKLHVIITSVTLHRRGRVLILNPWVSNWAWPHIRLFFLAQSIISLRLQPGWIITLQIGVPFCHHHQQLNIHPLPPHSSPLRFEVGVCVRQRRKVKGYNPEQKFAQNVNGSLGEREGSTIITMTRDQRKS